MTDEELALHPATAEDDAFLQELYFDVHAREFAPLGLPAPSLAQLLLMQFRAQRLGYSTHYPQGEDRILWVEGSRVGRVLVDHSEGVLHLVDLELLSGFRGRGYGSRILEWLTGMADQQGKTMRLQVRFGNPARRLYERHGFVETGALNLDAIMERPPGGEAAVAPAPPTSEEPNPISSFVGLADDSLSSDFFRSLVGQTLVARAQDGVQVELVLQAVVPLRPPRSGGAVEMGDSFYLDLIGPPAPILNPAMVELVRENRESMPVFVSPVGNAQGNVEYECVFNRSRLALSADPSIT